MNYKEAVEQILKRKIFFDPVKDKQILLLKNELGITIAHWQATAGYQFDPVRDKEILKLRNIFGMTVAEIQLKRGYLFDLERDKEILALPSSKKR
ncbi:hypothetical protein O163_04920 [Caldanaerobacter subterraneus subsp. yonseiensis KB-1]|uniref:Uncharacterized protein n=1 Tax=Caldanaerobacter subterraneus subsp. yonseiensis KB-1 TaxID=1388761 RepID=U5CRB8_CALSX|nr:hypothetical protein [Caldanaerobacter subterraneus]ERM92508.1 hypothetical protein O163_04920 [Caldanaerobacter subterraneus subsp. yonseiensis KB-1]